jgi:hypothetical protein
MSADKQVTAQKPTTWVTDQATGELYQQNSVIQLDPYTIFDEFVPVGSTSAASTFTSVSYHETLASDDALQLTVRIDDVLQPTAASALCVFVETSCDGRRWLQRADQTNTFDSSDAELMIPIGTSTASGQTSWSDSCKGVSRATSTTTEAMGPLLAFARLRIFFTTDDVGAHVRVLAHGIQRKGAPGQ